MTKHQIGDRQILAGHDASGEAVWVLRKCRNRYFLHRVKLTEAEMQIRAFMSASQCEAAEIVGAILQTKPAIRK